MLKAYGFKSGSGALKCVHRGKFAVDAVASLPDPGASMSVRAGYLVIQGVISKYSQQTLVGVADERYRRVINHKSVALGSAVEGHFAAHPPDHEGFVGFEIELTGDLIGFFLDDII